MKSLQNALILILAFAIIVSCDNESDEKSSLYCDHPTGDVVSEQLGRIYKWKDNSSDRFFHYIGNPDIALKNGGFVPCNDLPSEFIPETEIGILVTYSGIVKLGQDAEEPLYFGIEITSIIKSGE
jgi:hypothetical protein